MDEATLFKFGVHIVLAHLRGVGAYFAAAPPAGQLVINIIKSVIRVAPSQLCKTVAGALYKYWYTKLCHIHWLLNHSQCISIKVSAVHHCNNTT